MNYNVFQAAAANGEIQQNGTMASTNNTSSQQGQQIKTVVNSSNVMSVQGLQGQIIQVIIMLLKYQFLIVTYCFVIL